MCIAGYCLNFSFNGNIINNISNNIGAMTARCVHSSGAWTGRNLIVDVVLTCINLILLFYINFIEVYSHNKEYLSRINIMCAGSA